MLDMTTATFVPQPYALFGVLVERADEPARFEPALDPIRLVLGWSRKNGGCGRSCRVARWSRSPTRF
jgi:hypothetical protein